MQRAFPILGFEIAAIAAAWLLAPWAAVPAAAMGLFFGAWATARPSDDRALRRQIASRVGIVNGLALAGTWWIVGGGDPEIAAIATPVRIGLAVGLGAAAGLAGLGLALIGLDARFIHNG